MDDLCSSPVKKCFKLLSQSDSNAFDSSSTTSRCPWSAASSSSTCSRGTRSRRSGAATSRRCTTTTSGTRSPSSSQTRPSSSWSTTTKISSELFFHTLHLFLHSPTDGVARIFLYNFPTPLRWRVSLVIQTLISKVALWPRTFWRTHYQLSFRAAAEFNVLPPVPLHSFLVNKGLGLKQKRMRVIFCWKFFLL